MSKPTPAELWQQADGDAARYRELMREHGHLIPGTPRPLPCGWPTTEVETALCACGRRPLEHGVADCPCPSARTPDDLCPACSAAFDCWWAAQVAQSETNDDRCERCREAPVADEASGLCWHCSEQNDERVVL